jgi:hypothetical protein
MRDVATVSDQRAVRGAPGNRIVTWTWFVAVGAAVTFGYYVLPHLGVPREAQSIIFILTSTIAALTVLAGVVINKPAGRLPWLVLAGAQGMYSIGDTIYYVLHTVLQRDQYPDLADVFYLAQYPLICLALVIFIRRRTPIGDEARVRATASIGLATMPADGSTPHDLLHGADQALFAAKRAGRNRTFTRHGPAAEPVVGFPMMDRGSWSAPAPRVASDPSELPRWGGR